MRGAPIRSGPGRRLTTVRCLAKDRIMMASPHAFVAVLGRQRLAIAAALAVGLLAAVNWIQAPDQALRWLRIMLMLPAIVLAMTLWYAARRRPHRPTGDEPSRERYFRAALTLAVMSVAIRQLTVLGLEIWVRYGDHGADLEPERRILGLATAAVFLVVGNTLPKILTPLSMLPLRLAERVTRARRVVGTIWVGLGMAMTIGYLAMPLAQATLLARGSAVVGIAAILAAIVWMNAGPAGGREVSSDT
jgi:hypothetical protein